MEDIFGNRPRAKQLISFNGLRFGFGGKLHPSDIDLCFDLFGKAVIFMEFKTVGTEMPNGQRKMLERLCRHSVIPAVAVVGVHSTAACQDIDAGLCRVEAYYLDGKWQQPETPDLPVRRFIEKYADWQGIEFHGQSKN